MSDYLRLLQTARAILPFGVALVFTVGGQPIAAPPPIAVADPKDHSPWGELLRAIDVLTTGTREEKLAVIARDDPGGLFYGLDLPPDGDPRATRELVRTLRDYLIAERDPWIADRVAASLAWWGYEEVTPLFAELALHPAPSVRLRAVEHFVEVENDEVTELLETMWEDERVPWVRAALFEALRAEGRIDVEECKRLAWEEDPELAAAAIDCLPWWEEHGVAELLVARAAKGDRRIRWRAACELAHWHLYPRLFRPALTPGVRGGLESLFRKSEPRIRKMLLEPLVHEGSKRALTQAERWLWHPDERYAHAAVVALGSRMTDETRAALRRRAAKGAASLRAAAIDALARAVMTAEDEDLFFAALDPAWPKEARLAAVHALGSHRLSISKTDGDSIPTLIDIAPPDRARAWLSAVALSDPDETVRTDARKLGVEGLLKGVTVDGGCSHGTAPSCDAWRRLELVPPSGANSLRCHPMPGTEAPPGDAVRATAAGAHPEDRFDDGREPWVRVDVLLEDDTVACWLPAERVRWQEPEAVDDDRAVESLQEFDLAIDEVEGEAFLRLVEAGMVETFDLGQTLAGVRLTVDPEDEDAVAALRAQVATQWPGTRLERATRALADSGDE